MIGKGTSIAHTGTSIDYGWNQEKDAEVVFSQHLAGENAQGDHRRVQAGTGGEHALPKEHPELYPQPDPGGWQEPDQGTA